MRSRQRQTPPSPSPKCGRSAINLCIQTAALLIALFVAPAAFPQPNDPAAHTDPINLTPQVHEALDRFYNLDYDGALARFEAIQHDHPGNPMAIDYVQMTIIFRELYHQDLLDTTYYAHDNFLTSKRSVTIPQPTLDRIESLTSQAIALCDQQLKADPTNKNAFFARGYAHGMHAAFITFTQHSYVAAARQGLAARSDSEQALRLDPGYADAKMAVGIQQFAVANLPRFVRILVGIAGIGGNRGKGLALLREAAAHGTVTPVQARTALALFLRHDGRYPEALTVEHGLVQQFPHGYLFRLEEANLTKDEGNGPAAIALYKAILADARKSGFFSEPRLHMAYWGLADTQRGQNDIADAAKNYLEAAAQPTCTDWIRRRAQLNAGEMFDLLHNRPEAIKQYELAAAGGGDQSQADAAHRYLKTPYTGK
jgi:tetratricopeptide (TPR) repeat protein